MTGPISEKTADSSDSGADWEVLIGPFVDRVQEQLSDQFDDLQLIGRGGMAFVFRGRERALDRDLAIKVLPAEWVTDPQLISRFKREAKIAAGLNHPHILAVHHVGVKPGLLYYAMTYLSGGSLAQRLGGPLPEARIRQIMEAMALALDYAHSKGVIHRDVKPANILFDERDRPLLADFGIAKRVDQTRMTGTNAFIGTPHYLSPEQASGGKLDGRSDLYSLGAVCYHMATGQPPFEDSDAMSITYNHVNTRVVSPRERNPHLSSHMEYVILRLLQKKPQDRFASGAELAMAFEPEQVPTSPFKVEPPVRAQPAQPRTVRYTWFALCALLIVAFVLWPRSPEPQSPVTDSEPVPALNVAQPDNSEPAVDGTQRKTDATPEPVSKPQPKPLRPLPEIQLVDIPEGIYKMGSRTLLGRDEWGVHEVSLGAFQMSTTEVTQELWQAVMGSNPSCEKGDRLPVTGISRAEINVFLQKLNQRLGSNYRLPTEAEWEYACKAGERTFLNQAPSEAAWYAPNASERPHEVGRKKPNDWGLFDMQGNVWELCQDLYQPDAYKRSAYLNPLGPQIGEAYVIRGGSYLSDWRDCRSTNRDARPVDAKGCDVGFRLVRPTTER
ncbi:MAG: SUMF1/EgtB/PvdO family nonheme iron enzyme [Acidobacteria bacterium]|nr:SUMF1/EgtB/PvdO family nonheme iron enzyme [Acidobacteriota bacterium]MCB9398484.1 SUMF1/EgtB/PvdO family nonheme iron enzyme [Acidobacteriota bacterium]